MSVNNFQTASFLQEKQIEEAKQVTEHNTMVKRERRMLLGFFVISLLATLFISGALNIV